MGKMPLAGLIGACSLGMLLTGCNCCSKNGDPPAFAKGRTDTGMGWTKSGKGPESKMLSYDSVAGNSMSDSSAGALDTSSGSYASVGNGSGSFNTQTAAPTSSSGLSSMGANMTSAGGPATPLNDSSPASLTPSSAGFTPSAAPIRTVSHRTDDASGIKDAGYRSLDADTTPALPMRGSVVPPTPSTMDSSYAPASSSKTSGLSAMGGTNNNLGMTTAGSSALPPPTPPPSNAFGDVPSSMAAGALPSRASTGGTSAPNPNNVSMPSYLMSGK